MTTDLIPIFLLRIIQGFLVHQFPTFPFRKFFVQIGVAIIAAWILLGLWGLVTMMQTDLIYFSIPVLSPQRPKRT